MCVTTTNNGNLIFIMKNSNSGGLGDTKYIFIFKYFESYYYFDFELFYFRNICSPSQISFMFGIKKNSKNVSYLFESSSC